MDNCHGLIEVNVDQKIITAKYVGLFNRDGLVRELGKLRQAIDELLPEPFAILIDDLELEGGTPDAYEALEEFNQWLNTQPLAAKATVVTSSARLKIIDARVPSRKQQNHQAFQSIAEAEEWLQSQLT